MEGVNGLDERRHRVFGVGVDIDEPLGQAFELAKLSGRNSRCLRLFGKGGGHGGVSRHAGESLQLAVRQQAQQVDHGGAVFGVVQVAALHDCQH